MSDQSKIYIKELIQLNKYNLIACGYEKLSVDNTVKSLTAVPASARYAEISLESDAEGIAIRCLELGGAGTQPSTTEGIGKPDKSIWDIHGRENINNFRITRAQAGTHTIYVQYYK